MATVNRSFRMLALASIAGALALLASRMAPRSTISAGVSGEPRSNNALVVLIEYEKPHLSERAPIESEDPNKPLTFLKVRVCFKPRDGGPTECDEWTQPNVIGPLGTKWQIASELLGQSKLPPHAIASSLALRREKPSAGHYEISLTVDSYDEPTAYCSTPPRVRYWVVGERQREVIPKPFEWAPKQAEVEDCKRRCCSPAHCNDEKCRSLLVCNYEGSAPGGSKRCNDEWPTLTPSTFAFDYP
jgi:hypothetical protein